MGDGAELLRYNKGPVYIPWGVIGADILRPDAHPVKQAVQKTFTGTHPSSTTDSWVKGRHSLLYLLSDVSTQILSSNNQISQ